MFSEQDIHVLYSQKVKRPPNIAIFDRARLASSLSTRIFAFNADHCL